MFHAEEICGICNKVYSEVAPVVCQLGGGCICGGIK